jgi:hypothetical protein
MLKKIVGTSNQPIRTKNFPKKTKSSNQDENSPKKNVSYLKSVKKPKIRMGATRRNLQAQPKILKE